MIDLKELNDAFEAAMAELDAADEADRIANAMFDRFMEDNMTMRRLPEDV